ncbi:uncharacterized protein LOC129106966 isoform X2 [Anoplopoma fimbria]|uniref:uncharacterized protein LOC129106966 isoform X2 n=1 Tax=Anoplopoma fimbria TaxID=229290 RepID=UPI0023EDD276|nr:uncharacterized protein LOC129106966 isoform X2 [Anoplopoma fimbria]
MEGSADAVVQSECRERYLWIHVTSLQTPRFEAVDGNGVHSISEHVASRCGYTISTFKMDGFTTFRASYYSCFTHNQDDEVFTFSFNVIVSDSGGMLISRPVSAVCAGLIWTHREIICEEDYMEVNVNREPSCGGQRGDSGQVWQAAFSQSGLLNSTWPTVQPDRTTLLDPTCGPKQTDGSRVLFEFKMDSCGTRRMVGETYMVYENEILHDGQLVADGPNFISRESQFKLTVRCFYPLSGVNRLSVDRIFSSETPGFGSVKVLESLKDSLNQFPGKDCSHQKTGNAVNIPTNQVYQMHQITAEGGVLAHQSISPRPKPGPSHFITVPRGHNKLLHSSQNFNIFPNLNLSPPPEGQTSHIKTVPLQVLSPAGHFMSQKPDQQENPGLTDDNPALDLSSSSRIPDSPTVEQFESDWGSFGQTLTLQGLNS